MAKLKQFFQQRGIGFYLTAIAALLSLIIAIVYIIGYTGSVYFFWFVFWMPLLAAVAFIAMAPFKFLGHLSACVTGLIDFIMLLLFIVHFIPYLTGIFYSGITAQALSSLDFAFVFTLFGTIVAIVLANMGMYMSHARKEEA